MIHIFIGTKAQYVKTAPVIAELDRRGIAYNLIDSGQHGNLAPQFRSYFGIRQPDVSLGTTGRDITSVFVLVKWLAGMVLTACFRPRWIKKTLFKNEPGICCIHGDTPTTLISLLLAKRAGLQVAHLESGLRSYNIMNPFPEEIIRIIVMRFADFLFTPGDWAKSNLEKMKVKGKIVLLSENTNLDSIKLVQARLNTQDSSCVPRQPFVLATIHRAETLLDKKRLRFAVESIQRIAAKHQVVFCMHPPTARALRTTNLINAIANHPDITVQELLPYPQFIHYISNSLFVITDGGSIQEECYYLNKPCLLMRAATERQEGIGANALLCAFDKTKVDFFLNNLPSFCSSGFIPTTLSPSSQIVDLLQNSCHA